MHPTSFKTAAFVSIFLILSLATLHGATWYVPDDFPKIRDAVKEAADGDTIIVRPGIYFENLGYFGKAVTVKSQYGADVTIINGGQAGTVVGFSQREGPGSVLDGFTLTNGKSFVGGGIACMGASPTIVNNVIVYNSAIHDGGGIYCFDGSPILVNNIFADNIANYGGGVHCCGPNSSLVLTGNSIHGNTAVRGGGMILEPESSAVVTNTIFWRNSAQTGKEIFLGDQLKPSVLTISYCDVEGGQASVHVATGCTLNWGAGMIDADPLFVEPEVYDLHLTFHSPCRNAGTNSAPNLPAEDMEGDPRVAYAAVDLGADEFHSHLYHKGAVVPGGMLSVRIVGEPGSGVMVAEGSGVKDPPLQTPYGLLYLEPPVTRYFLSQIPPTGVGIVPAMVPASWNSGEQHPFQSIVWDASPGLTNLMVLTVE